MTPAYQPTRNGAPAMSRTVIVLAAGEGKRMKSALPKVLHPLLGRTLLGHVLAATAPLAAARTLVVVGNGAYQVRALLAATATQSEPVNQERQHCSELTVTSLMPADVIYNAAW